MRARLTALLTAVLMAVLWTSSESIAYLCSMDGERRTSCCCTPGGEHAERDHSEVERRDCCKVERTPANALLAVAPTQDDAGDVVPALAWTRDLELGRACAAAEFVPTLARGPPQALGPPQYLRNCRFLI